MPTVKITTSAERKRLGEIDPDLGQAYVAIEKIVDDDGKVWVFGRFPPHFEAMIEEIHAATVAPQTALVESLARFYDAWVEWNHAFSSGSVDMHAASAARLNVAAEAVRVAKEAARNASG